MDGGLDRRELLATGAAGVVAGAVWPKTAGAARRPPLGRGGTPMSLGALAKLAREIGEGQPLLFVDLAAVDQNAKVVVDYARTQGWAVRPALKTFRSPRLIRYVLERLPEPRGLVFNLTEVAPILAVAPPGTDLMTGYPPTFGELEAFLATKPPRKRHRLRILVDSVALMERLAALARRPLEVALEFDVGMGKGGLGDEAEIKACADLLRGAQDRLELTAVLGYDGHATLAGDAPYRQLVARQAQSAYWDRLNALDEHAKGLFDGAALVRNGPASSNYRNWAKDGPANEISPGSAFVRAGYLEGGYDVDGLAPALTMAGALRRITSDYPSVPAGGQTPPGASEMEIVVQGIAPAAEVVMPSGVREDELSGGGDAMIAPKGSIKLGEYLLFRPEQAEVAIVKFGSLLAVRDGTVRRVWETNPRPRTT